MRLIILILFLSLGLGYFITYHVLKSPDWQWYAYFVTNDLKALLLSVALMVVTYKKKGFEFACAAAIICFYDLVTQVMDLNQKGNWADIIYRILITLTIGYALIRYVRTNH